jgi:hypothetical protein
MGQFRVIVQAIGNHGCERERGDGENVVGCERVGCVDCISREFVRRLKRSGAIMEIATLEHWPAEPTPEAAAGEEGHPVDDLLSGIRSGSF